MLDVFAERNKLKAIIECELRYAEKDDDTVKQQADRKAP